MRAISKLHRDERGLTGLETIVIIISFTVLVAVTMYVLFAGSVFSAERSKETIYAGVNQAKTDMEILGSVMAKCVDDTGVRYILFSVRNNVPENPIDMTQCNGTAGTLNKTVISLSTATDCLNNVKWTSQAIGAADNDNLLEVEEQFEVTIDITDLGDGKSLTHPLGINSQFTIQVKPARSSALVIKRIVPAALEDVMDLH